MDDALSRTNYKRYNAGEDCDCSLQQDNVQEMEEDNCRHPSRVAVNA